MNGRVIQENFSFTFPGTNGYFYCGRFSEGGRDRASQQYLIEPGHCYKTLFHLQIPQVHTGAVRNGFSLESN